jgi:hypothetical protein
MHTVLSEMQIVVCIKSMHIAADTVSSGGLGRHGLNPERVAKGENAGGYVAVGDIDDRE